jgi:hypothetical protein
MVAPAGYACPRCATALRFQADVGWACDACRVVYPVQGAAPAAPAAPFPPASMRGAGPIGARPGGLRAMPPKTRIAVLVGSVALALVIVFGAVLLLRGGVDIGGKASAREVLDAAIDRASAGDLDGLVELSLAPKLTEVADCASDRATDRRSRVRSDLRETLDDWKGMQITVTSVDEDGPPDAVAPGRREMGCRLERGLVRQRYKVKVHAKTTAGDEGDSEIALTAIKVGDGWFLDRQLGRPPAIAGIARLEAVKNEMCGCHQRSCAEDINLRFSDLRAKAELVMYGDDERRINDISEAYEKCFEAALSAGDPYP